MLYVESGGVGYVRLRWGLEGFVVMVMVRPGENQSTESAGFLSVALFSTTKPCYEVAVVTFTS
jgi:hypothetical protein